MQVYQTAISHVRNEMEDSRMKINFTYKIFISHIELKQFTYEI